MVSAGTPPGEAGPFPSKGPRRRAAAAASTGSGAAAVMELEPTVKGRLAALDVPASGGGLLSAVPDSISTRSPRVLQLPPPFSGGSFQETFRGQRGLPAWRAGVGGGDRLEALVAAGEADLSVVVAAAAGRWVPRMARDQELLMDSRLPDDSRDGKCDDEESDDEEFWERRLPSLLATTSRLFHPHRSEGSSREAEPLPRRIVGGECAAAAGPAWSRSSALEISSAASAAALPVRGENGGLLSSSSAAAAASGPPLGSDAIKLSLRTLVGDDGA